MHFGFCTRCDVVPLLPVSLIAFAHRMCVCVRVENNNFIKNAQTGNKKLNCRVTSTVAHRAKLLTRHRRSIARSRRIYFLVHAPPFTRAHANIFIVVFRPAFDSSWQRPISSQINRLCRQFLQTCCCRCGCQPSLSSTKCLISRYQSTCACTYVSRVCVCVCVSVSRVAQPIDAICENVHVACAM